MNQFDQYFVGFDRIHSMMNDMQRQMKIQTYPPYNIKKTGENSYAIELAVAGFGKQDIEITLEDSTLKIDGRVKDDADGVDKNYLFKGIAERPFSRTFTLADTVEIKNAELINGMLRIFLDNLVPEKKAKKVEITEPTEANASGSYGYLSE